MRNKTLEVGISAAVLTSAFVVGTPSYKVEAATNIEQLMTNVQNSSTVLKWAISVEGSADGVTQPWIQYNATKVAIANAEKAIKQLSFSDQLKYEARLADAKTQLKRSQGYLDAITASTKINEKTNALSAAVSANNLNLVEKSYHEMTAEFRKQTILLDRVYGQSTRDKIRNAVKGPAEKLINELKNDVTVHMLTKGASEDIRTSKQAEASRKIHEAQAILDANVLYWENTLQKSLSAITSSIPVQISSVSRIDDTTVSVKLNRAVASVKATEFTFDNNLSVTNASLSSDGTIVTLKTSVQTPSFKYTLKYKGNSASFTVPGSIVPIQVGNTTIQHRETAEVLALTATFAGTYGNNNIRIDIPAGIKVLTINGIENSIAGAKSVNVVPDRNGTVTITFTSNNINVAALDKVFTFNKMENNKVVETQTSGYMNFYVPAKDGSISSKKVQYVDLANNYFVTADGIKYHIKGSNDTFRNESIAISYESFKAALNIDDTITGTYKTTSSSSFNIATNHYSVPLLVDSKFAYKSGYGFRMIGKQIELKGTGQPNYELFIFKNSGSFLGKIKINSAGTWSFNTNLEQNAINDFYMVQQVAGKAAPLYTSGNILRVIEGPFDLLSTSEGITRDEDISNEEITFTIAPVNRTNGTLVVQDNAVITKQASIIVSDEDGTKVQFTNNENGNLFSSVTNGFKIKFGPTKEGIISGVTLDKGADEKLTGTLDIISIDGVSNGYDLQLKVNPGHQIKVY